jgi:hypothetical protein
MPRKAVLLTFIVFSGCSRCETPDDETQIRALVAQGAQLAEKHDLGALIELTTADFVARPQHLDRQSVKGVLLLAFRRYGRFKIRHPRPEVELDPAGGAATATLPFVIVRQGRQVPDLAELYEDPKEWLAEMIELADIYYLELGLTKEDDQWLVRRATLRGLKSLEDI